MNRFRQVFRSLLLEHGVKRALYKYRWIDNKVMRRHMSRDKEEENKKKNGIE